MTCFVVLNNFWIRKDDRFVGESTGSYNYDESVRNSILLYSRDITLCVLVRVYGPQVSYLPVFALGLLHAGFYNVRIYIINTDRSTDNKMLKETIESINKLAVRTDFITLLSLGKSSDNDYGYTLTDQALSYLYDQYEQFPSICQYLIVTNGDNLYSRYLGSKVLPHMIAKKDIIAWDFVSRYERLHLIQSKKEAKSGNSQIFDDGTAKCISVVLEIGGIDLGAAAYRLEFLTKHRLQFRDSRGDYTAQSDGYFMSKASRFANSSIIIRQTLFIHQ